MVRTGRPKGGAGKPKGAKDRVKRLKKGATFDERFLSKLKLDPDSGCLIWQGNVDPKGYGYFGMGKKLVKAHRYAWERAKGPIPKGKQIDHLCHNPSCCNPEHMELVTPAENTRRGRKWPEWDELNHCYGEEASKPMKPNKTA